MDVAIRIYRVKMFEQGHSFDDIDNMSVENFADVLEYWRGDRMGNEKRSKIKGKGR